MSEKKYDFFVGDSSNLDVGYGEEFENVKGLSAKEAVRKYKELKDNGYDPYIGLHIPGDVVFDFDGKGAGCIFMHYEDYTPFYLRDNFVRQLWKYDEHAENVLDAYDELYEEAVKEYSDLEKPGFLIKKEEDLRSVDYFEKIEKYGYGLENYEDGSGHFYGPDNETVLSYDLTTREYNLDGEWWPDQDWDIDKGAKMIYEKYIEPYEKRIDEAEKKFQEIVKKTFLTPEEGEDIEKLNQRYKKWYKPEVEEITKEILHRNEKVIDKIEKFEMDYSKYETDGYSKEHAFNNQVTWKLLPDLYNDVQEKVIKKYEAEKTPYVVLLSSESPKFPTENKAYTLKDFNQIILDADKESHNRKDYAKKKYGSVERYWDLEEEGKLPEEDRGITFGYDKTNFKIFNIPNLKVKGDTFSYQPSRYDIGDGNGSVFDYVRSTCSHDEFIEAINEVETDIYHDWVNYSDERKNIDKIIKDESETLSENVKKCFKNIDEAKKEYDENKNDKNKSEKYEKAAEAFKDTYESSMKNAYSKVLDVFNDDFELAVKEGINESRFLKYTLGYMANEVKKMVVNELYRPSREAQKAMNQNDLNKYSKTDWEKHRKVWEQFPANCNMDEYSKDILQEVMQEKINKKTWEKSAEKVIKEAGKDSLIEHKLTYKLNENEQNKVKNEAVKKAEDINERKNVNQKTKTKTRGR